MISERIYLDSEHPEVFVDVMAERGATPRDAILVVPGGGYGCVCADREGGPIAEAFIARGYNAFVLGYRVAPHRYPAQLCDAARAMAHIRENAERYGVNPDRIFTVGFSAGGHLVGTLSTQHKYAEKLLGLPENLTRPSGTVYAYPVVSTTQPTHGGSLQNLSGKEPSELTEEERKKYSIEKNVTPDAPPAFIWHTAEDELVPPCGSLRLAEAYMNAGVPVTLHVYPYGIHGIALATEKTANGKPANVQPLAAGWIDYAVEFFNTVKG